MSVGEVCVPRSNMFRKLIMNFSCEVGYEGEDGDEEEEGGERTWGASFGHLLNIVDLEKKPRREDGGGSGGGGLLRRRVVGV